MEQTESRRRVAFALALAALIVGAVSLSLLDPVGGRPNALDDGTTRPSRALGDAGLALGEGGDVGAAAAAAVHFTAAYLQYEVGSSRALVRSHLSRYSTVQLGGELLRAPVRVPPGARVPRQSVAGVAAVRPALFNGRAAYAVAILIRGEAGGTHLLHAIVIGEGGRWRVAGVGP